MTARNDMIRLAKPLKWFYQSQHCGFVTEIGFDQLVLTHKEQVSALPSQACITVQVNSQQSFELSGATIGLETFQVSDAHSQEKLQDLLGQIRKQQHIDICNLQDVEASDRFTGFNRVHFIPNALPEMGFEDIDTSCQLLSRSFDLPILITGMTGGVDKGTEINKRLALAAAHHNIPMGVGSQRVALENPEYASIFRVKQHAPNLFLIGNLGFSQLRSPDYLDRCKQAIDMIQADMLAIHVNVIQEAVQMEGDRDFRGVIDRLHKICDSIKTPIMVKEVGSGISPQTARLLQQAGVQAIDIGGRGGTSWGYIEGLRSSSAEAQALAQTYRNWGIPTAYALAACRQEVSIPTIATGGIRDGLTVAKAVALGAKMTGIGLPLLRAALESEQAPTDCLGTIARGLKVAMIATGSKRLSELKQHLRLGLPLEREFEQTLLSEPSHPR